MGVVTTDLIAGAQTEFAKDFSLAKDRAMAAQGWPLFTRKRSSKGRTNTYTGFGAAPVMQDVGKDGELRVDTPYHYSYSIDNSIFKGGFEVDRSAFEDDDLGEVQDLIADLGNECAAHPGRLALNLLTTNGNAFDGAAFFADTRVIGESANIDNKLAITGQTAANIRTDLALVRGSMALFQDDKGIAMNLTPTLFVVRPEMSQAFYEALNSDSTLASSPTIPQTMQATFTRSGYTVVVSPLIPSATWFAFSIGGGTKYPLIYQERIAPKLEFMGEINETAVRRDKLLWAARGRYAAGYGDPRTAIRVA